MKFCWPEARVAAELHISFCLRLAGRMVLKWLTVQSTAATWWYFAVTLVCSSSCGWLDKTAAIHFTLGYSPIAFVPVPVFVHTIDRCNCIWRLKNSVVRLCSHRVSYINFRPSMPSSFFHIPSLSPFICPSYRHPPVSSPLPPFLHVKLAKVNILDKMALQDTLSETYGPGV